MKDYPKPKPHTDKRQCLKCGGQFDSTGPGNRICVGCSYTNSRINDKTSTQSTPSRATRLKSQ